MSESATEPRRDRLKLVEPALDSPNPTPTASPAPEARAPESETKAKPEVGDADAPPSKGKLVKRAGIGLVAVIALGAGLYYGVDYWQNGRFIVSTDDAYVGAEMATISAKLAANISKVSVVQNQQVKAGEPLVTLDDGDWRIALATARAKTATAQASLSRIDSQIEAGRATLEQAQAQLASTEAGVTRTTADFERANSLAAKSYGSQATLDAATAARSAGLTPMPPMLDAPKAAMIAALRQYSGVERDRLYLVQQQMAHKEALGLQKSYAETGDTPQLRNAARATVPIVEAHLAELQRLMR